MTEAPLVVINEQTILAATQPILPPELQRMLDNAERMAEELVIVTPQDYEMSYEQRRAYAQNMALIEAILNSSPVNAAVLNKLHREAVAHRKRLLGPIEKADIIVERKRIEWASEQRRIAARKEEEQRAIVRAQQDEAALTQAAELQASGEPEAAQAVLENAAAAPPPVVVVDPDIPKAKGASTRKSWGFRITNPDLIPRKFMEPDMTAIGASVRTLGPKCGITGIEVFEKTSESIRQ